MATTKISKLIKMNTADLADTDVFPVVDTSVTTSKKITYTNLETDLIANPLPVDGGGTGANLSGTGGANQFVKQASAGANFTVGAIAAADLPSASETAKGAVEIATQAETDAGTDTGRVVVPARMTAKVGAMTNIGEIRLWSNATPPSKWLICDGAAVNRTTFADLFAEISTTFGVGDGSTTFNIPQLSQKSPIGVSGSYALASTGGEETHVLTEAEMPAHTHTYTQPSSSTTFAASGGSDTPVSQSADVTGSTGSDTAHANMPPYRAIYFIIYAGA